MIHSVDRAFPGGTLRRAGLVGLALLLGGWLVPAAQAQYGAQPGAAQLQWLTDPQAAVQQARKTNRPIFAYVLAATRDRDDDVEAAQRKTLADPAVVRSASRFVLLRLSRSQHRNVLADFGFSPAANMEASFIRLAAAKGEKIGDVSQSGLSNPDTLLQKLDMVFKEHRRLVYESDIRPVLEKADTKTAELKTALRGVIEFEISEADRSVIALLSREKLDPAVAAEAYEALAVMSTKPAIEKLADAADKDAKAAKALESCNALGAEHMMEMVKPDAAAFRFEVYKAACKICGIKNMKEARWWDKANDKLKADEVNRVRELVRKAADRYRKTSG